MSSVTYAKLPHPLREGDLLYYDPDAVTEALEDSRGGSPPGRLALGAAAPPEEAEVRGLEGRLRRGAASRSRGAWGRFLWWAFLGPALTLLWVNFVPALAPLFGWFPPLAALISSLGGVTGGPLLSVVVGLVPLLWAWGRAGRHLAQARRWGRIARLAGTKRLTGAGLERRADPAVAGFAAASAPFLSRLHEQGGKVAEQGADAAAEMAVAAREMYRLAQQYGLPGVAGAYHGLYTRFDAAEQGLTRLDRAGGMLAERKMSGLARRVRSRALAALAAFAPQGPVRARRLAPVAGFLAGLAALAGSLFLTGIYFVNPGEAVIVDPFGARVARLAGAAGLVPPDAAGLPEVVRTEGFHLGLPRPLTERHSVSLQEQRLPLRAALRQTGPDRFDVLEVEMRFRISDPNRWAQIDRDGTGAEALGARLSVFLQSVLEQQRQEARRAVVQQNPSLANNIDQRDAQADALVEARLGEIVREFMGVLSESSAPRDVGIQISRESQSRLVRGVPGEAFGATPQG
jgi:regulator of protease activity HflC (stomatin/prohibitin superfamily)